MNIGKIGLFIQPTMLLAIVVFTAACGGGTPNEEKDPDILLSGEGHVLLSSQEINESGGALVVTGTTSKANGATITIPEGALDKNTIISISEVTEGYAVEGDPNAIRISFEPSNTIFNKPVEISIPFAERDDTSNLTVMYFDEENKVWISIPTHEIDIVNGVAKAYISHFSVYTVVDLADVSVTLSYSVGGSISGLSGSVVVQNNGGDNLSISDNGQFTFSTPLVSGTSYSVSVLTQPDNQTCTVDSSSGTVLANIDSVLISCTDNSVSVGGSLNGLIDGGSITIENNGSDELIITKNGSFVFNSKVIVGEEYLVEIKAQSNGMDCEMINSQGTASSQVSNISIICTESTFKVSSAEPGILTFSWPDDGSHHYKLLKNPGGAAGFSQIGNNIQATSIDIAVSAHLEDWVATKYIIQSCNQTDICTNSNEITAVNAIADSIGRLQILSADTSYAKEISDGFGGSIAISDDGKYLAIGSPSDDSSATGINGDQADRTAVGSGAVFVFERQGSSWVQHTYLKASNTEAGDFFGSAVAFNADGKTLAISAPYEDSGSRTDQSDNTRTSSGAVYVFERSNNEWSQQAYLKVVTYPYIGVYDRKFYIERDFLGWSIALSADGDTLAVGVKGEDGSLETAFGQVDNTVPNSGAVYIFQRNNSVWGRTAHLKADQSLIKEDASFGYSVDLSSNGNTLAVGAPGVQSQQVFIFVKSGEGYWEKQAHFSGDNTETMSEGNIVFGDNFGASVALSSDGNLLAVGAPLEDSGATGINGDGDDNSRSSSGAVYLFARTESVWNQNFYIKPNEPENILFGSSISISNDGTTLLIGTTSNAYVFDNSNGTPYQISQIEPPASVNQDVLSISVNEVLLSADGNKAFLGANRNKERIHPYDRNLKQPYSLGIVYYF